MIGYCKHLKREILSEADCWYCIETNAVIFNLTEKNQCEYWTEKRIIRYKCSLCGRDKFSRPYQPHKCRGNFRKSKFGKFKKIVKYEGEK